MSAEGALPLAENGFAALNEAHERFAPRPDDLMRYGRSALGEITLLKTPDSVLQTGYVLTNPCQSEYGWMEIAGEITRIPFAYFRRERAFNHLGTSEAVPYTIRQDDRGQFYLSECVEASIILGEDPRLTRGVRLVGHLGVHTGSLLSTTQAEVDPSNPDVCLGIRQAFYWGEKLNRMEQIGEGPPGVKNTTIGTLYENDTDTSVSAVGRPFPHLSYHGSPNLLEAIDPDRISYADIITENYLPDRAHRIHIGPNNLVRRGRNHFEINAHEACVTGDPDKKTLAYRLANYGFEIPDAETPTGRLVTLGTVAERSQFPDAEPKLPEGEVGNYRDILYGSAGNNGHVLTGVSDRHVGYARRHWLRVPAGT